MRKLFKNLKSKFKEFYSSYCKPICFIYQIMMIIKYTYIVLKFIISFIL